MAGFSRLPPGQLAFLKIGNDFVRDTAVNVLLFAPVVAPVQSCAHARLDKAGGGRQGGR